MIFLTHFLSRFHMYFQKELKKNTKIKKEKKQI